MGLRAIIFDFNGVIVDDEMTHFLAFQQVLRRHGLSLTKEQYYGRYLGMDERACATALLKNLQGRNDPALVQLIAEQKAALFNSLTAVRKPPLFPGVVEFVRQASERYRLAIASGGRRGQIEFALRDTPIERYFAAVVSAEETPIGKPDPAIYLAALERLNACKPPPQPLIEPAECLVIEDSLAGIQSARRAGMKVMAVATTYTRDALSPANVCIGDLNEPVFEQLEDWFQHDMT
jgi:HAD superfamily hydrolase (TIGR01509 family)